MRNTDFFSSLMFSIGVTLPILLMLCLGIILRKRRFIDDKFCEQASKIIFNLTLPVLLFFNIFNNPIEHIETQVRLLSAGVTGTLLLFFCAEWFAAKFIAEKKERGTFVQGVYRSNAGILGLAFCVNAYGDAVLAPASLYTAVSVLLYNVLGVITISRSLSDGRVGVKKMLLNISKNPLIIAIVAALIASWLELRVPKILMTTGNYLANVTLPLALICAGASIDLKNLFKTSKVSLWATIGRIIVAPIFMVFIGKAFGLTGMNLGVVLLISSTPLAAATYAMVRGMGGNAVTVANIIGLTTFGSMFGSALGLLILSQMGWI
ncbi:AEC family transporter [Caviibacterium pharyngocola]|uniref:Malonate transporter n=1 Tax=Caviibacterium pharyngocola TaxID=28159 RepID=A0A2M8RV26_9PAST|nr:AEC family transporter [Caviibacterium pharyngocola]PJG82734.1 malonate transporter [Caviibacterium pharyngocola]